MQHVAPGPRDETTWALVAGAAGAALASAALLTLAVALDRPSLPETLAEAIATLAPLEVVERSISTFGSGAKHLLLLCVLLGQIAVGGGFEVCAHRRGWTLTQRLVGVAALIAAMALVVLPVIGSGFLGASTRAGAGMTLLGLLAAGAFYLAGTALVWRYLHPGGVFGPEIAASRRAFLRNLAVTAGGLSLGVGGYRWLVGRLEPPAIASVQSSEVARTAAAVAAASTLEEALELGVPGLAPELTPNDSFYVVSKNFLQDPTVDATSWRLEVVGSVDRPMTLTYDDMKALASASQYFTLQCISNVVGGELIGNAQWRGAPLADLLRNARVHPAAVDVVLHAADGYTDSIPLAKAMQPDTMLAYEMNGAVLPRVHGFPVRLLVPDLYGMKNVKWVTKVEIVDYDYKGYWMQRGWTDESVMHTTSRIDVPRNSSFLRPGPNYVGGVAVAGRRGIQRVEVSTDGGQTWKTATLKPALGPNAWSLWLFTWEMADGGASEQTILVRATDGAGALQTATVHEPVPEGATGYHTILVKQATG